MNFIARSGCPATKGRKSRRSIEKISQLLFAVASAVRACPSSTAISPNNSPAPIKFKIAVRPSAEDMLIFTVPVITANRLLPGSPLETMVAPRLKVKCFA